MSTQTGTALSLTRVFPASPQAVFEAWTTPDQMKAWCAPEGVEAAEVNVDLRVGGRHRIRMHAPDGGRFTATGAYREIEPAKRLVYTWRWEEKDHDVGETLVTVLFNDLEGSTEVVLTHEQFPNADATGAHEQGWSSCLTRLGAVFAT